MKTIIVLALSAGVILGVAESSAFAAGPTGRVLVLDNERTLTGDIELVGDQYRIKRLIGETFVPASKVLKLCASLEEAYQYLRSRANLNDADERLRLSDWCRQHHLRERAWEEAEAALKLRPRDEKLRRLATHLRETRTLSPTPSSTPSVAVRESSGPRAEVTAESLGMFASKIQPILMNACVSCHNPSRESAFQLTRVSGPGMANRKSMEANLAATLAQLNGRDPAASKLLTKAISIHGPGMAQAPLKGRDAAAFRTLESWVVRTIATNAHLREEVQASVLPHNSTGPVSFGQDREPLPTALPLAPPSSTAAPVATASSATAVRQSPSASTSGKPEAKPMPLPVSEDPVDPAAFNREFHPKPTPPLPGG